jgi:gliding motility-associated-like protein
MQPIYYFYWSIKKLNIMKYFFISIFLIATISTYADKSDIHPKIPTSAFIENVGQLEDMNTLKSANDVLFYISTPNAFMYLRKGGISYLFHENIYSKTEEYDIGVPKIEKVNWQRVDVDFVGANAEKVIKENPVGWTYNFFYAHCPNGIMNVKAFQSIIYKNVYPGIDWHIYFDSKGELKYDFIVNPGANPDLIKLKYNYSNQPVLNNDGNVLIKNNLGIITEKAPTAVQELNTIPVKWETENNCLSFNLGSFNNSLPLTIDPYLIWSTYLGNTGDDEAEGIASDDSMIIVTGGTPSPNFPTSNPGGSTFFQGTNYLNPSDLFIAKFSIDGVPEWITFYGGNGDESNKGRVFLSLNYILIAGQTGSTDFPTFNPGNGAYYDGIFPTNGDVYQGYIIKFNRNGERLWATYLDGNPEPGVVYSITANSNSIFTLSLTMSTNFPTVTPGNGAYFQSTVTNNNIAHYAISKFDINTNAMQWSTYFSSDNGSDGDWNNIVCDENHLFLVGNTTSPTFPTLDPGNGAYFKGTSSGGRDGVIARFTTQGVLEWSTYFGGNGDDEFRAATLANGKLFIGGNSTSTTNFPIADWGNGAYYQPANGGSYDGIIASFTLAGQLLWSTYYGGNGNENTRAITADNYGIWVSGKTTSTNLPLMNIGTPTYYLSSPSSAFLIKFKQNGIRQWATYLKASEPRRLSTNSTSLYLVGFTTSGNLVTQNPNNGAYFQSTHGGGTWDAFIAKFDKCVIPVVNITKDTSAICRFDSTWIYGHGGVSYLWNTTAATDSIHVSPLNSFTYVVTVTDDMTCKNTDSIAITVYPLPVVHIVGAHPICFKDSIELYGNGAHTYVWMPDTLMNDSIHVSPPVSTTYYILGTDSNNCKNIDSAKVVVYPLPNVTITGEHPICFKDSIELYGNGAHTYVWMPNTLTADSIHVSPPLTTTYYMLGTDTNGCKNIDSAEVVVYSLPNVEITGAHPICFGDSIMLYANGAQTYLWTPVNLTTDSIHVAPIFTTTYYLLGTDTNQCKNIDSAKVIVYSLPNVHISGTHPICFNDSITLTAGGALSYIWYPDTLTGSIQLYHPDTTSEYIVIGTDFHNCKNSDTTTVVVYPLPNVQILGAHAICYGDYIDLTAIHAEHYSWNNSDTTSTIHVNPPQTFNFIVVGTDTNGCINSDTSQVVVNPLPPVRIFGVHPICHYDSIAIAAFGATSYTWFPWGYHNANINISPDSTTQIILMGVDNNGCINSDTATLVVYPLPNVYVTGVNPICFGNSVTISAHGAATYNWTPINLTGDSITISPPVTTSYQVLGTDTNQCKNTANFSITVFELPVAQITGIDRICQQEMVTLQASGGDSYIWSTNETASSIQVEPLTTTTYSLIAIKNICSDTATFTIHVDPKPEITLSSDTTIIIGMTLPLHVSGANTYIWTPVDYLSCTSCSNPTTRPSETIEYCVEGVNSFGCSDTACMTVTVDKECGETFVPSAFSPNGDGNNDLLYVRGKCIKTMQFEIYNRWGEKVFVSTEPTIPWDGTFKGKSLDTGVFVYYLKAEYYNGVIVNQKGNITLIR